MGHHGGRSRRERQNWRWYDDYEDTGEEPRRRPVGLLTVCDICGTTNLKGARACRDCENELSGQTCPECGAELLLKAQFCNECGRPQ